MAFEDFQTKQRVVVVYTGVGKGKTSAALGLLVRALGTGWRVAFVQFVKSWDVGEDYFLDKIGDTFGDHLSVYKGGKGFYEAGELSAAGVTKARHKAAAKQTYDFAREAATSGKYDLVICDEINNAVQDGLISDKELRALMSTLHSTTSLCLTGRDFPERLHGLADIVTEMKKLKHHYDDKFLANKGIDY